MEKEKILRINELARLSKERDLTDEETKERALLRDEYILEYRRSLTDMLDATVVVRPDGTREKIQRKEVPARDRPSGRPSNRLSGRPSNRLSGRLKDGMRLPLTVKTNNVTETENLAGELANLVINDVDLPRFIALYGDLGAGKTAFVRGFAAVAAPGAGVKSPTFAIVHEYSSVFHFDMYRIKNEDDLYSTGFYDYLDRDGYILTEWSENIPFALPSDRIEVYLEKGSVSEPDVRKITVKRSMS